MNMSRKNENDKVDDLIHDLVHKNTRRVTGKTVQKELSIHRFISSMLNTFIIADKGKGVMTLMSIRSRMQELVNENVMRCDSHEFSVNEFIHEIRKEFTFVVR